MRNLAVARREIPPPPNNLENMSSYYMESHSNHGHLCHLCPSNQNTEIYVYGKEM